VSVEKQMSKPDAAELLATLKALRAACEQAYKAGRLEPEPFVRAGVVIARAEEQ
jgi:hypothetical protein